MVKFNGLTLLNHVPTDQSFSLPQEITANKGLIIIGAGPKLNSDTCANRDVKQENKYRVDVQLSGFAYISRRHAQLIVNEDGSCTIQDLASSNGVFVNHVRVATHQLKDGDVVQFGGSKLIAIGDKIEENATCIKYVYHEYSKAMTKRNFPSNVVSATKKQKVLEDGVNQIEIERLYAELASMKDRFREQGEIISQRNATVLTLTKDKETLAQLHSDLQAAVTEMNKERAILRDDLARYKENSAKLVKKLENQKVVFMTDVKSTSALPNVVAQTSGISTSTLHTSLICTLCDNLLLDAVVLPCSHGYCRACIEMNWSGQVQNNRAGPSNGSRCRCPRCNFSQQEGGKMRYVRSDHLDNMVWLLLEASTKTFQQEYDAREKRHRQQLQSVGVDPDAPLTFDVHAREEGEQVRDVTNSDELAKKRISSPTGNESSGSSSGLCLTTINATQSTTKLKTITPAKAINLYCDFCGEDGHIKCNCPHTISCEDDDSSTGTEDSEADEEDDI